MVPTMLPIHLSHCLIAPHSPNRVFDHDATARKRAIIRDILGRSFFSARFAAWCRSQGVRMQLIDADVCQIANPTYALGQARAQARLCTSASTTHPSFGSASIHLSHERLIFINAEALCMM